ncbi:hypothetical protein [Bordetella hinzii]|uniref:hypothetical protein n=1 Tax=Alcaligenaceae TaxID=506 RepID=UPI0039FB8C7D
MTGEVAVLRSQEEALQFLQTLLDQNTSDDQLPEDVDIQGELASMLIEIEGANYHSSITGNLSRGLWELQQEIYRAVASTLHGAPNIKRLTKEELQDYNLVIDVEDGCSKLVADVKDIVGHLKDAVNSMESRHKLIFLVTLVVTMTAGTGLTWVKNNEISADKTVRMEKEKTAQMEVVRKAAQEVPALERWVQASENGARSIAKSVSDADSLSIGNESLNKQEIAEVNQRAAKEVSDVFKLTGYFRVTSITEPTSEGVVRVGLSGNGEEFLAYMNLRDENNPIPDAKSNAVFLAPKHSTRVYMEVKVKRASDGIREAFIVGLPDDPENHPAP